jgi:lysophospholipase L1-like esterase
MKMPGAPKKRFVLLLCLAVLAACSTYSTLYAQLDEQAVSFRMNGRMHRVEVRLSEPGSDIIWTGEDTKNLSLSVPGENLFPKVTVSGNRLTVSWMQYHRGNVQLFLYDSFLDYTRRLPLENFTSAYPLTVVFYRGVPRLLLFKGNVSDNTDVFYYHLGNGSIKNITRSSASEQKIDITDEGNKVFIKTETLFHRSLYRLRKRDLDVARTEREVISREIPDRLSEPSGEAINTIVGFGDSITWGKIRMNGADDDYHPEQAYLAQLQGMLADDYGETFIINLGVPGETSFQGTLRMHDEFSEIEAFFLIVFFGTNDVTLGLFDADTTIQNLENIVTTAETSFGMYPIMTTIPPQKWETKIPGIQFFKEQTEELNAKIIEFAQSSGVPYIDIYAAFMAYPEGWDVLLEAYKGNHPSPLGHEIIAGMFRERVLELSPAVPENIIDAGGTGTAREVSWDPNIEFDFGHYFIRFGFSSTRLNRSFISETNACRFLIFPYYRPIYPRLYFRVQSVDKDGNAGDFTPVHDIRID